MSYSSFHLDIISILELFTCENCFTNYSFNFQPIKMKLGTNYVYHHDVIKYASKPIISVGIVQGAHECMFIAALLSPAGKGLTFWLLLVMSIVFLLLSHVVSWVRCGTSFVSFPDLCHLSYF